ncbi:protein TSSC4-like [Actinia tenebrosa]|uniref:U5 small nuclear ribonucleoprotein TSSC4 n=1 Tax=Actinia tenebrosa TaxID=6105 RepID=A0A6P8H7P7_ACTTE|nr:protein TSSC4-like [Actinia tenebrosa]
MSEKDSDFLHIQGDIDFQERSKSVFSSLDRLEPKNEEEKELKKAISRRPHKVPDHVLHPDKWKKYSLEEDGSERMGKMNASDINKHAALSFLNELKERKKSEDTSQSNKETADAVAKELHISFHKPKSTDNPKTETKRKSVGIQKDGVHMMPEYVVGKAKLPAKSKKLETSMPKDKGKKDVQIGHLLEKEEEEIVDEDVKGPGEGPYVAMEDTEKEDSKKEEVRFAKRKRKQEMNIRKHVKVSDDEEKD